MKKKTEKVTLCFTPEVAQVLEAYANKTMQSRSRAVAMLIMDAAAKQGVCVGAETKQQQD
jgi:hypothetical protein